MSNFSDLEFFSPYAKTDELDSSVLDISGIEKFNIKKETDRYPFAFFVACYCKAINPLKILDSTQSQIEKVLLNPMYYEKKVDKWILSKSLYKQIPEMTAKGWFLEWVKLLGNRKMVFCFNNDQQQLTLF